MIRNLSIAVAVALTLAACASANKRYEQGQELLAAGRPAEAANRYIEALKKNSRLDSARVGLRTAGAAAIDNYLRVAADPATQPDAAAEQFLAIDDLSRRAIEVGIFLPPPGDYDARKRAAFDKAIADDIADAPLLAAQRQFAGALQRLSRASSAYQPSAAQQLAIGNAGGEVALAWGRADTTEGRFRSAYARVQPIATQNGLRAALTNDARALMEAALARGTRRIAVVPAWATVNARRDLPEDALPALGDALLEEPWTAPPAFVSVVPAHEVERDLRRLGLSRRTLTTSEAARLARTIGADYVVVAEIDSTRRDETNVRGTRRPVRTRAGVDTAYLMEEGNARLFAQATYVLIDQNGQRGSEYRAVTATGSAPFTRVRYNGDWRTLDLRLGERDLFVRGADDRDLVRAFVPELSQRLGEAVFTEVVRVIP